MSTSADHRRLTAQAAERLLSALPSGLARGRIADIGCGTGTFLDDPRIVFSADDLEVSLSGPPVDLVLSLEVAQHLSPGRAPGFVAELCAMAPAVLFSAAIPGQGGAGHRNAQWPSYWAALFALHGFSAFDVIRPVIRADERMPASYRQNTILYLRPELAASLGLVPSDPALLDRVLRQQAEQQQQ